MSEEGKSSTAGCNIEQRKLRSAAQTQLNMCTKGVASSKDTTASTATEPDQQPCLVKITFPENYSAFSITFVIKRIFSAITFYWTYCKYVRPQPIFGHLLTSRIMFGWNVSQIC